MDDRFLLTRSQSEGRYDLALHDLTAPERAAVQLGETRRFYNAGFSSDGRFLLTLDPERNASLLALADPETPSRALGRLDEGMAFAFSPDARFLAVQHEIGDGLLYDLAEGGAPIPLGRLQFFTFSPDSRFLTIDNRFVSDLATIAGREDDGRLRVAMCRGRDSIAPFQRSVRTEDGGRLNVYRALRGRPWNPCDWRGLLALLPNAERGDGWFEGFRQWFRLIHVRYFGGRDWACEETTAGASVETRARRRATCERFAPAESAAP